MLANRIEKEFPCPINILYEKDGHVVTITINRPEAHNCINWETAKELQKAWQTFRDDKDAFVAIMTGAGDKAFCGGWNLKDAALGTGVLEELMDYEKARVALYNSPRPCGYTRRLDIFKPTIGAINGYCFAAGFETALTLDIRIASDNAESGFLERRWNIVLADGGTVRLPLIVWLWTSLRTNHHWQTLRRPRSPAYWVSYGGFAPEEACG